MASIKIVERPFKVERSEEEVRLRVEEAPSIEAEFTVSRLSPVVVKNGSVEVDPSLMKDGELVFFEYKGRRYLAEKVAKGIIRIYEIEEE